MLENTHTLDADYIYRDFKELIVELDYFDKEDLSDKTNEVMQWPLPEASSKALVSIESLSAVFANCAILFGSFLISLESLNPVPSSVRAYPVPP
jgi:hypothetical protein